MKEITNMKDRVDAIKGLTNMARYNFEQIAKLLGVSEAEVEVFAGDGRLLTTNEPVNGAKKAFGRSIKEFFALYTDGKGGYDNKRVEIKKYYYTVKEAAAQLGWVYTDVERKAENGFFDRGYKFAFKMRINYHGDNKVGWAHALWCIPKCVVDKLVSRNSAGKHQQTKTVKAEAAVIAPHEGERDIDGVMYWNVKRTASEFGLSTGWVRLRMKEKKFDFDGLAPIKQRVMLKIAGTEVETWFIPVPAIIKYAQEHGKPLRTVDVEKDAYRQITLSEEEALSVMVTEEQGDTKAEFERAVPDENPRQEDNALNCMWALYNCLKDFFGGQEQ